MGALSQNLISLCLLALVSACFSYLHQTELGSIMGIEYKEHERTVVAFHGIPYGKAERWKHPEFAGPWTETHKGLHDLSLIKKCPQPFIPLASDHDVGIESEDCLQLNIVSPRISLGNSSDDLPVLVFFHGGGFVHGSPHNLIFNGTRLSSDGNLVFVTVGYRLGYLGFWDENYGLLDQRLALEWVQKYISNFGGDRQKVTILGHAAGANSVLAHVTSVKSHRLFIGAIAHSPALGFKLESRERGFQRRYSEVLSFFNGNLSALADAPAKIIARAFSLGSIRDPPDVLHARNAMPFADGDFFVSEDWELEIARRNIHDDSKFVPTIIGFTSDEMKMHLLLLQTRFQEKTFKNILSANLGEKNGDIIFEKYAGDIAADHSNLFSVFSNLVSDATIVCPCVSFAQETHTHFSSLRLFAFDAHPYVSRLRGEPRGAIHGLDLSYLFSTRRGLHHGDLYFDASDIGIMEIFQKTWTSFAQDPSSLLSPSSSLFWPPYSPAEKNILNFSNVAPHTSVVGEEYFSRCDSWKKIQNGELSAPVFWVPPGAEPWLDQKLNTLGATWMIAMHYSPLGVCFLFLFLISFCISAGRRLPCCRSKKKTKSKSPIKVTKMD